MKIKWYWSLNRIPEFSDMSVSERRKEYHKYLGRVSRRWEHVLVVAIFVVIYWFLKQSILAALIRNVASFEMKALVLIVSLSLCIGLSLFLYTEFLLHLIVDQIQRENTLNENASK